MDRQILLDSNSYVLLHERHSSSTERTWKKGCARFKFSFPELECVQQYIFVCMYDILAIFVFLLIGERTGNELRARFKLQFPTWTPQLNVHSILLFFFWVFLSLVEGKQDILTRNRNNWFRNKGQIQNCISCILSTIVQWECFFFFLADFINTRTGKDSEKCRKS